MATGQASFDRNIMLELYSSESCSSCPPADLWVGTLVNDPKVFKTLFPVVFHVDYWNHLSWKDGLSSDTMTQRQIDLSHQWDKSSVYTPGFIVNGLEWRKWGKDPLPESSGKSPYQLKLAETGVLQVTVDIKRSKIAANNKLILRAALLGFGIETNVTDGENTGRKLTHNFVVLDWDWKNADTGNKIVMRFKRPKQKYTKLAAVAWLEEAGNPTPLQVTGGFLK